MNVYRILDTEDENNLSPVCFRHTLKDAQEAAKTQYSDGAKPDVRIQLIEIQTSVQHLIAYLNGEKPEDPKVLRCWKLTPRGGLVELGEDGKPLEKQS